MGGFTPKWQTGPNDSPKRNLADLHCIAEILSRFDIVAVQETKDNLQALRVIMSLLGSDWGLLMSDVTRGAKGNLERLGYVFDLRRVRPTGLVGELVLSPEDLQALRETRKAHPFASDELAGKTETEKKAILLEREHGGQLDRTPYVASFTSAGRPFMLASVHIVWGVSGDLERRAEETGQLARLLENTISGPKGEQPDEFRANLLALGDFNAESEQDPIVGALKARAMVTADVLAGKRRTLTDIGGPGRQDRLRPVRLVPARDGNAGCAPAARPPGRHLRVGQAHPGGRTQQGVPDLGPSPDLARALRPRGLMVHPVPSERARELLRGGFDPYVHVAPDFAPRRITDLELAERCLELGLAGFGLMSHYTATAERAAVVNAAAGAPLALGSIVLNHAVGGLNATAVEVAARQGVRFVWLPTVSALGEFAKVEQAQGNVPVWVRFEVELRTAGAPPRPVPVLDESGGPLPDLLAVLRVVAAHDLVLATGHLSRDEIFAVVDAAVAAGVEDDRGHQPRVPVAQAQPRRPGGARGARRAVPARADDPVHGQVHLG